MSKPIRVPAISEFAPRNNNVYNGTSYPVFPPKDPDRLNYYVEKDGDHVRIFKRPGKSVVTNLDVNATTGQGLTVFNGTLFAVVNDSVANSDALVFPAGPPNSGTDGTAWTNTATGPWAARDYAISVVFNNALYLIGGQSATNINDVWVTYDGVTWSQVGVIPFGYRFGYNACVFNGAIYVMGGIMGGVYQNDVWRSTDGVNWVQITLSVAWPARQAFGLIATSTGMFVLGGVMNTGQLNDVWSSTGLDVATNTMGWQQQTPAAGWSIRSNPMTWYLNNTLFIGGGLNVVTSQNDVWSSTNGGVTWTQLTAAAFLTGIDSGATAVYNNKLWMFGGQNGATRKQEIYTSPTGVTWTNIGNSPTGAAEGISAAVYYTPASVSASHYQTLWLMGGDTGTLQNKTYRATLNTTLTNVFPLASPIQGDRYDFQSFSQNTQLLIKSRTALFVADQGGVQRVFDGNYPPVTVPGIVVLGDSAYVMDPTGLIFGSPNSNPYVWPAVNRIPADYESDPGVAIAKHLSYLVAFGTYTTQFFYDAGVSPGSALLPYLAASVKIGCYAASTVQTMDKTVIWVSQNKEGLRQVCHFNGTQAQVISTPAIDRLIAQGVAPTAYYSDFITIQNHEFYLLTMTSGVGITLVYDVSSGEWLRWSFSPSAGYGNEFLTGGSAANLSNAGQTSFFLDFANGNVYSMGSLSTDTEGNYYFASQTAKFDGGNNTNKFWGPMEIVGDIGTGTINVQFTDDDYNTWSPIRTVDMSTPRPILYQNGQSRRRAILITQFDANPRALEYIEFPNVEQGE